MSSEHGKRVFIAGASGAIGRPLCRLLVADGWTVVGTTRSAEKAAMLRGIGVEPAVLDVFDKTALFNAVLAAKPEFVVHQLTDLPPGLEPGNDLMTDHQMGKGTREP